MRGAAHLSEAVMLAESEDEEVGVAGGDLGEDAFDFAAIDEGGFGIDASVHGMLQGELDGQLETVAALVEKLLGKVGVHGERHVHVDRKGLDDGDDAKV
jgi:hypothetical protein